MERELSNNKEIHKLKYIRNEALYAYLLSLFSRSLCKILKAQTFIVMMTQTQKDRLSLFKDIKIHPLPQQSPPQHDPISVEFPWQSAPPSKGAGFLHSRILDLKQLTSQVLHSPHSVHPPSTGLFGL